MAKITIFGLAGTGTSTLGKLLAERLNHPFISTGNLFRAKAKELNLDLVVLEELCKTDPSYDQALDEETARYGREHQDFVFESRLAWHFIPDSFKVKVICDQAVRIARVATRDGLSPEEATAYTAAREALAERYIRFYQLSAYAPDSAFDLIIDSTHQTPEEIVEVIIQKLSH